MTRLARPTLALAALLLAGACRGPRDHAFGPREAGRRDDRRGAPRQRGAGSRAEVDRFHAAALAAGGTGDGPPGIREHDDPGYDAAFVRDPDGHRLEAVHHELTRRSE